jgi:hypothetical protein
MAQLEVQGRVQRAAQTQAMVQVRLGMGQLALAVVQALLLYLIHLLIGLLQQVELIHKQRQAAITFSHLLVPEPSLFKEQSWHQS